MEINLESLSPDEFFGTVNMHSQMPETSTANKSSGIGNIIIGIIIGGIIVYIFRYNIEFFFNGLSGKSLDESE